MAQRAEAKQQRRKRIEPSAEPVTPISSVDPPRNTWRRRLLRFGRRFTAVAAFALAAFVAYVFVAAPLLDREGEQMAAPVAEEPVEAEPVAEPPPRPESVPQRIPGWAWTLNEWHSAPGAERGERPADAPTPVPDWYWEWREWREELAAAEEPEA